MLEEDSGAACGMVRVQLQWRKNSKSPLSPLPQLQDGTLDHDDEDENQSSITLFFPARGNIADVVLHHDPSHQSECGADGYRTRIQCL